MKGQALQTHSAWKNTSYLLTLIIIKARGPAGNIDNVILMRGSTERNVGRYKPTWVLTRGISVGAVDDGEFHQLPLLQLVLTVSLWKGDNVRPTPKKPQHTEDKTVQDISPCLPALVICLVLVTMKCSTYNSVNFLTKSTALKKPMQNLYKTWKKKKDFPMSI